MTPQLEEQLAAMAAELTRLRAQNGMTGAPPAAGGALGWMQPPAAAAPPSPVGWSVGIEIQVQGPQGPGKATVDLAFSADTWPQAPQIVQALIAQGLPVRVFTPKQNFGGGGGFGGGSGYGRRPWNGGGGGFGGGGNGFGGGWRG